MNIYSIYFILIQLRNIFEKSENDAISDFIFLWVCGVIFSELNTLQSRVIYHFQGNFV